MVEGLGRLGVDEVELAVNRSILAIATLLAAHLNQPCLSLGLCFIASLPR